jgi:hypothetical protein
MFDGRVPENALSSLFQSRRAVFSLALRWRSCYPTEHASRTRKQGRRQVPTRDVPDTGYTATKTYPSDSNTRSTRAPRAQTRDTGIWSFPRRGRPPHRARAQAPRATAHAVQRCRQAGRADVGEGTMPLPLPTPTPTLVSEWEGERRSARALMIRTSGLGGHDALRATRTREVLRPSERVCVRTCVARGSAVWEASKGRRVKHTTWTRVAGRGRHSR